MDIINFFLQLFRDLVSFLSSWNIYGSVTFLDAVVVFGVSGMLIGTFVSRGANA